MGFGLFFYYDVKRFIYLCHINAFITRVNDNGNIYWLKNYDDRKKTDLFIEKLEKKETHKDTACTATN